MENIKSILQNADSILIGAGAGLSTSAGFTYSGPRFQKYFADFEKKYGFHDMYSGGFTAFESLEENWAYWSRQIYLNRFVKAPLPVYEKLLELVRDKNYFVLMTNVDHCFQKAGFDKSRLFYTQGDYGLWQCSKPCHDKTYDNKDEVTKMVLAQGFSIGEDGELQVPTKENGETDFDKLKMVIPTELVPHCPVCGEPMSMNLRADDTFVEDEGWHKASERYSEFLRRHKDLKVIFLELAVGFNTPGIIKYSFWQMTHDWKDATYACLNYGDAFAPDEINNKSICINADIGEVLDKLK